ncbi:MAG: sugar phosphate isomerase/epimerase family protein [Pirellulaceae bacterium]
MILGYNTNGLAHHDLVAAIDLLASIGYRSAAIAIDHAALNPYAPGFERQLAQVQRALRNHGLRSVIETGARFLLDPRQKHEPTLVSADSQGRARRVEFLKHAIDIAAVLQSDCVSLWSGAPYDDEPPEEHWERLLDGLIQVLSHAADRSVCVGFEPEPGMFIDSMARDRELIGRLEGAGVPLDRFRLTLDVGHLHCQDELPIADEIHAWAASVVNVHLEDMRRGVHEHLMFGEGEIDFSPVIAALEDIGYTGPVHVELSRHSHVGPTAARQAFEFLTPLISTSNTLSGRTTAHA